MGVGIASHIAGMSLFSVHDQHRAADFIAVPENRLIHKGHTADDIPSSVGIQRTSMITALCLVVIMIIFHKERRVLRYGIHHAAARRIISVSVIFDSLRVQSFFLLIAGGFTVFSVEISVGIDSGHVVHGGNHRSLDSGI